VTVIGALSRALAHVEVPEAAYVRRLRALQLLVWLQAALIGVVCWAEQDAIMGRAVGHRIVLAVVCSLTVGAAVLASVARDRGLRTYVLTVGLVLGAIGVVQAGGGVTELHFEFFVVLAAIGLLHSARALALATALVGAHYLVMAAWMPEAIFAEPPLRAHPEPWALLAIGFVLAACLLKVLGWRFLATEHQERNARTAAQARAEERRLEEERAIAEILHAAERARIHRRAAAVEVPAPR